MELKQEQVKALNDRITLLIVPYGIETSIEMQ